MKLCASAVRSLPRSTGSMVEAGIAGDKRSAQEWAQESMRAWRWTGSTRVGSMEMEMGGGARAMGLMYFGPEGVGVGEKRATVVRRAILAEAAMTDRSFAARRANGGRGWADDNEETSTLQQAAEKASLSLTRARDASELHN